LPLKLRPPLLPHLGTSDAVGARRLSRCDRRSTAWVNRKDLSGQAMEQSSHFSMRLYILASPPLSPPPLGGQGAILSDDCRMPSFHRCLAAMSAIAKRRTGTSFGAKMKRRRWKSVGPRRMSDEPSGADVRVTALRPTAMGREYALASGRFGAA